MKVKVIKYCQEKIDGHLVVLDVNKVIDIQDDDAQRLIEKNLAVVFNHVADDETLGESSSGNFENKMINVLYKKRGRPRKEG